MGCNCIEAVNREMQERTGNSSARLDTAFVMDGNTPCQIIVINATYRQKRMDGAFGKKKILPVRGDFCPFCGKPVLVKNEGDKDVG